MRRLPFAFAVLALAACIGSTLPPPGGSDMSIPPDMAVPSICANGFLDGDETDTDCGGSCTPCGTGRTCKGTKDCASAICANRMCSAPACTDMTKNGDESDVDCGGSCMTKCAEGKRCNDGPDCASLTCVNGVCAKSPCEDGMLDGMETDVDCGGLVCMTKCADGKMCVDGTDCSGGMCINQLCKSNCPAGMGDCDGDAGNGCETNTNSDAKNCSGCGKLCPMNTPACVAGKCSASLTLSFARFATCNIQPQLQGCSVAIGDLNADKKNDLVVGYYGGNVVSTLLNAGNGTFAAAAAYGVSTGPAALGDFDGDKKLDAAVAYRQGTIVSILPGAGNGALGAAVTYRVGVNPFDIAVGDISGDGKLDVVVPDANSPDISVLINKGNGTFGAAVTYPMNSAPQSVALGDVNGDGKLDVAVTDQKLIRVFINKGNGTLAAGVDYPVHYGLNSTPQAVLLRDVNGDGKADMLATSADGGNNDYNLTVFLNQGNGAFAPLVNYPIGVLSRAFAIGDLDSDGRPDVAVSCAQGKSNVDILLNKGAGVFAAPVGFAVDGVPSAIALGDLDGDGKTDVASVTASGGTTVSVLLNTSQ